MEEFEELIAKNGFLEHAQFSGNRYGTRWDFVIIFLAVLYAVQYYYYIASLASSFFFPFSFVFFLPKILF